MSNTEFRMLNNEVKTSAFDIQHSLFDIKTFCVDDILHNKSNRSSFPGIGSGELFLDGQKGNER